MNEDPVPIKVPDKGRGHRIGIRILQEGYKMKITINVPVVYMVRYKVVLRGDYP
jgi:hypothetical protein